MKSMFFILLGYLFISAIPTHCCTMLTINNHSCKIKRELSKEEQGDTLPKNNIGIQINPYMRSAYIRMDCGYPWVYALRYGYRILPQLQTGIDARIMNSKVSVVNSIEYNFGPYTRYSVLRKNIAPFIEGKIFYYNYKGKIWTGNNIETYKIKRIDYYFSPGVSFFFFNKHIQFDAMFLTNYSNIKNGGLSLGIFEFSYRVCYNWGKK